jgi:hypothetical protein
MTSAMIQSSAVGYYSSNYGKETSNFLSGRLMVRLVSALW